ncbi:FUSC family protein [Granulicella tundricola]|uniref:Fusaric acid resistance protein conserved region n=1 Tax=Granulicella tundricola (strain ATCC BAA-1859 / DSM 23138 / MP5ACTX9) TaxID=1198114 RepID=E8WX21_GRATM|nr:FUSC family protein [Granulicella tundricola]ADW68582.1 Fusaric acid resistance protein conserved region [Granulicella tundricola MP5ACTX9]
MPVSALPRTPAAGLLLPRPTWAQALLQDLQPVPGRLHSTLRIVLASVIALLLLETLQMPFISLGLYFMFLVGRDSPAISFRTSFISLLQICFIIFLELSVVIVFDNDPMARLLSVVIVTFISAMILVATNYPALGPSGGLIFCTVISLWELHAPADRLVKTSLYLIGTFTISLGCAVAVEYIFAVRNPADQLQEQRRIRYHALAEMFQAFADGAPLAKRFEAATQVSRLASAGQSGMIQLYNDIVERNLDTGALPIAARPRITMLAQLMDISAAFGLQSYAVDDPELRERCARLAEDCHEIAPSFFRLPQKDLARREFETGSLLGRVENMIHTIMTMPMSGPEVNNRELVSLPSHKVPFFIPGAVRSPDSVAFALKISMCATFCYILYHALHWPGISTCVTTVLVTGLSSTGAIKQKLIFRVFGAIIGGLILGIGSTSLLFPHMDSITSLVVLTACVSFIAAWVAAGPKFNYIGLQIAFAFFSVAFTGFSAPTELAPARDRFMGILIALALMAFVFDLLWPVRTVTVMRRNLASVLRLGVDLLETLNSTQHRADALRHGDVLRDQVGKTLTGLRSANGSVAYEFGAELEQHIQSGDTIMAAAVTAVALFWNQLAVLHEGSDHSLFTDPGLRALRHHLANNMTAMAEAVVEKKAIRIEDVRQLLEPGLLADSRHSEYARNTVARYEELEALTANLSLQI